MPSTGMDRMCSTAQYRKEGTTLFAHVPPLRIRARALGLLASGVLIALMLSACGSSSPASSSSLSAKQQGCTAVSDVLADGPDPDADPVGYAEAQVLPLSQLR